MRSDSINRRNSSYINQQQSVAGQRKETKAEHSAEVAETAASAGGIAASETTLPLGVVLDVAPDVLRTVEDGQGGYESAMTLAFVNKEDREKLIAQGAVFPEIQKAILGDGVGPGGTIDVVPLYDTENENTVNVARSVTVEKNLTEIDPELGVAPADVRNPVLLAEGEGILPSGHKAVKNGAQVAPSGYGIELNTSKAGQKVESHRSLVNNITKGFGTFSGSSLAGVMRLPGISTFAPILALGSSGFAFNQNMQVKKELADQLGYLEQQTEKADGDMVTMETAGGASFKVSGKNEKLRLENQVRQTNMQLASTGLLAAAGATSIVGSMATAGAAGFAGMVGAAAATPFLAGGALVLGNGTMIFNSLNQLKDLSKERAELIELQGKGETHVDRVLETMDPELGRAVAVGEKAIPIPIDVRLKEVEKEQRKQRLLSTALSGAVVSIGSTITGLGAASVVGPLAMAPAAAILGGQSIGQLRELSSEKKGLLAQQAEGKTMVDKPLQQADGSYETERVPISTLLAENKKAVNKHKMILTSVGSAGAIAGMTLGAGMSLAAAAPLALVPLAVGAALFPDKVQAFADKVKGLIGGTFGEAGRSARSVRKETKQDAEAFTSLMDEKLAGLKESNPELFADRPRNIPLTEKKYGGYFTEMNRLATDYAKSDNPLERQQYLKTLNEAIQQAPDEAKAGLKAFTEAFNELSMDVEAKWLARDITLEMKTPVTQKVINDDRVKSRLQDLEFPLDTIRDQYEESLYIENTQSRLDGLIEASKSGDRDADRVLARTEVFKAARLLASSERELGVALFNRYTDAIRRPEDEENLELLLKEVGYRQQVAVTGDEVQAVSGALRTLSTPLVLPTEGSGEAPSATLSGPEARMESAFRSLSTEEPKLARELSDAFALLNNPDAFEGLDPAQAQQAKVAANLQLNKARTKLQQKQPELMNLWDGARKDVETAYFERSIDHEFKDQVLASDKVGQAAQELGIAPDEVEGLYMDLMRSRILQDPRGLEARLADESGTAIDPQKEEMLSVIDQAMLNTAAQVTGGGYDQVDVPADRPVAEDPSVVKFLGQHPEVSQVLASEEFQQLSANMQLSPDEVKESYLTLVQAELNPALLAEFQGRLEAGEMETVKTFQVGRQVSALIEQATRPSPEIVEAQLEQSMNGDVVRGLLTHPEVQAHAQGLGVNAESTMRLLLTAEFSRDASAIAELERNASEGDTAARGQLELLQMLSQGLLQSAQQVEAQMGGGIPDQAA